MGRLIALSGLALAFALSLASGAPTSTGVPVLRSVSADKGHLVVTFTLTRDLVPGSVLVATTRAALSAPNPTAAVKLRETIRTSSAAPAGGERWRTHKSLPAGTYFVEVSGIEVVGITGCVPRRADCLTRWSNARRVVIP